MQCRQAESVQGHDQDRASSDAWQCCQPSGLRRLLVLHLAVLKDLLNLRLGALVLRRVVGELPATVARSLCLAATPVAHQRPFLLFVDLADLYLGGLGIIALMFFLSCFAEAPPLAAPDPQPPGRLPAPFADCAFIGHPFLIHECHPAAS